MGALEVETVTTEQFTDQKPGTSGLRKKVAIFQKKHYTENFIQATLDGGVGEAAKKGAIVVVGGDGRFLVKETTQKIIAIAAANGVRKLIVGTNGFLSTPAVSCLIRQGDGGNKINGGIILTASHNPGGPTEDFGIKYNCENGGPAPDAVTEKIFAITKQLKTYSQVKALNVELSKPASFDYDIAGVGAFTVQIVDSVADYAKLMQSIFDFDQIAKLFKGDVFGRPFKLLSDSMSGATGPYVQKIIGEQLGADAAGLTRTTPLEDFGGGHPDPNLTYAKALVDQLTASDSYDMGCAFDGDGDRNMILGKKAFFVTPADSLAVIAANAEVIPYFKKNGVKGFARSMPTAGAVDLVAKKKGIQCYETPTGWKYFGNLMDAGQLSLCGEESFGTGSDHIREKDGVWAALAWLQIIAARKQSIEEIVVDHWKQYGRNLFTRYDYENVDAASAKLMMTNLEVTMTAHVGKEFQGYTLGNADNFRYQDPVDKSVAEGQGLRLLFTDGSRIVLRLSGTGSVGATIRLYVDSYINDPAKMQLPSAQLLKPLVDTALELSQLEKFVGRDKPDVIT